MKSYEQKYKEALEVAKRKLCFDKAGMVDSFTPNDIYEMFPELKESEDEKIRKELIGFLRNIPNSNYTCEEMALWLEKQGGQKQETNYPKFDFSDILAIHCCMETAEKVTEDKELYEKLKSLHSRLHDAYWIEKQSDKPQGKTALEAINEEKVNNANKVEPKDYSSIDPHFGKPIDKVEPKFKVKYAGNEYNVLEVKDIAGVTYYGIEDEPNHIDYVLPDNCEIVSEQKLADKVEPKFKAGDWIVHELGNSVHQVKAVIENISNGKYGYDLTRGGYISSQDANFYHLYTIENAKDGDVIYSRHNTESFEWIGIFKSLDKENKGVHFYGFWNNVTKTFKVCGNEIFVLYDDFSPATKEHRDTLMKAMADAGYTFDFEKKELKKIKNEIEIPFGAKDSELQEATYYIPKGFHAEIDKDKVVIKKGKKPTWSEEDEEILRTIISDGIRGADFDMLQIDWLKSLKDRYVWKPSDEQMDALDGICSYIRNKADWEISQDMVSDLYKLSEQLKKLRGEKQ